MKKKKTVAKGKPPEFNPKAVPLEIRNEQENMTKNGLSAALMGEGWGTPGWGVQLSQTDTLFKNNRWYLISNMRQLLSELYVEHGLVQTIIDVPVDDGLRGGIEIHTQQLSEDEITELQTEMKRKNDLGIVAQALKWNRLFGGAGIVIITDQAPDTDLQLTLIKENTPVQFRAVDMWELYWSKQNTEDFSVAIDAGAMNTTEFYDYYGVKVHHSRVLKMVGLTAPSFIRPRLRGWGFSVVETLIRSINQYLKANNLSFEVLDEFKVDVFKLKNLANTLLTPSGEQKVRSRVQLANQEKNYNNALTLDSEDDWDHKQLSFSGLAETMQGIRLQVASDMRMPLTKIFGISAQGFNSGEDDIENYNSMVESQIRQKAEFEILRMIEIRCQQMFGMVPDDLSLTFKPLRVLSSEQEENVKTQKFTRLLQAKQAGEISSQEFKEGCNRDKLLGIQLNPDVDTLETDFGDDEADDEGGNDGKSELKKIPDNKKSGLTAKDAPDVKNAIDFDVPKIVCVGLVCGDEVLTGKRRDNGLWTFPGGHREFVETAAEAACRECEEECGIQIGESLLKGLPEKRFESHRKPGKFFDVKPFIVNLERKQMGRTILDPDSEISEWRWVKISDTTPELKPENRHAKEDLIVQHLLKKSNADEEIMNPGVVDEAKWEKAKEMVRKEYGEIKWPAVTYIYKQMGGTFK